MKKHQCPMIISPQHYPMMVVPGSENDNSPADSDQMPSISPSVKNSQLTNDPADDGPPCLNACSNKDDDTISRAGLTLRKKDCALKGYARTYCVTADKEINDATVYLAKCIPLLEAQIAKDIGELKGLVFWSSLEVEFEKIDGTETEGHFTHRRAYITNADTILEVIADSFAEVLYHLDAYQEKGSGWIVKKIGHLDIHAAIYRPLRASSYTPLPAALKNKCVIVNIKNSDNRCFMWSVLAHLHHRSQHANYVNYYKQYENDLKFDGIDFPVEGYWAV